MADETPTSEFCERLIGINDVLLRVPYSRVHIGRLEAKSQFPRRIKLGENRVAWLLSEVEAWIASKASQRRTSTNEPVHLSVLTNAVVDELAKKMAAAKEPR